MTIALAIKIHDGVVLASDSATTISENGNILKVLNHQNKIFNLFKGLPIGGITHGTGNIGHASISTLSKDLRQRFHGLSPGHKDWELNKQEYTMEAVANQVRKFLYEEKFGEQFAADEGKDVNLGYRVAGYSAGAPMSEIWDVSIEYGVCQEPKLIQSESDAGIIWAGEPEAITRIVHGHSHKFADVLIGMGVEAAKVQDAISEYRHKVFERLYYESMPIQDAINLADFLVDLTIKFTSFKPGAGTVGGPIEIAVITKHEGFKWVRRKHYFDAKLNREIRNGNA